MSTLYDTTGRVAPVWDTSGRLVWGDVPSPPGPVAVWQQVTDRSHAGTGTRHTAVTGETEATYRTRHEVRVSASSLRLAWTNIAYSPAVISPMPNSVTLRASVEVGGIITQLEFNGAQTVVIPGGVYALSDSIDATVEPGDVIYVRTWVSVAEGEMWGMSSYDVLDETQGMGRTWGADLTAGGAVDSVGPISGSPTDAQRGVFPTAILGACEAETLVIAAMGSSSAAGWSDTYRAPKPNTGGFVVRAADILDAPVIHVANGGDAYYKRKDDINAIHYPTPVLASPNLLPVGNFGANDFAQTRPLLGFQREAIRFWRWLAGRGAPYWQITLTPYSSSTDGWVTVENQTPHAQDARRTGFNDWIRDGAPLTGTEPDPAGIRIGHPDHPLGGYIEAADIAESSRNSGVWTVDPIHGAAPTDGQHFHGWMHDRIAQEVARVLAG